MFYIYTVGLIRSIPWQSAAAVASMGEIGLISELFGHACQCHPFLGLCCPNVHFRKDYIIPGASHQLSPGAPASDFQSVIPNASEKSQSGSRRQRRPLSTPTLHLTQGLAKEPATDVSLSNLKIETNTAQNQPIAGNPPSPTTSRRKRPAADGGRERRSKARSSGGALPRSPRSDPTKDTVSSPQRTISARAADHSATATQRKTNRNRNIRPKGTIVQQDRSRPQLDSSSAAPSRPPGTALRDEEDGEIELLLQPETKPISPSQLIAEVRGIYAGLVLVESKCIQVDAQQVAIAQGDNPGKLTAEQWRALIALHKTLLHEHHDFLLASQHPAATPQLSKLAEKYIMASRLWRHGIHGFLEVLRHRLPESLEHMLEFVYIAYSMISLLYETVPSCEITWIECLGDLGRYRMSIEEIDMQDREIWSGVSRFWYSKAIEKTPEVM